MRKTNKQPNKAWLARAGKAADKVIARQSAYQNMSQEDMMAQTEKLKERYAKGEKLDSLLPDAYAMVREASRRVTGMEPYKVQVIGAIALHEGKVAELKTGEGKAVTVSTRMPTPDGWKVAGDIQIGDLLFDRHGKPTRVTGVYPQGEKEVYRVVLKDGRAIECCEDHLWSVYRHRVKQDLTVMSTKEMESQGVRSRTNLCFQLPVNEAVEYPRKNLPMDPYTFGVILTKGCKNIYGDIALSTDNPELAVFVSEALHASSYKCCGSGRTWFFYHGDGSRFKVREIAPGYEKLLAGTYSYEKWIPEEYRTASIEQRKELLRGILDGDCSIRKTGAAQNHLQFLTTSTRMRDDLTEVIYSLGYICRWGCNKKTGPDSAAHDQFEVVLNIPGELMPDMFRTGKKREMAEKAAQENKYYNCSRISIAKIERTGKKEEQVCFTVDNDEHLFLAGNYVVTHNTLVTAMPAYLNALTGEGVHIVTVNDYLAGRDAELMGGIHRYLGLTVGTVLSTTPGSEKKAAYGCDITYVTNTELGFDYLRDNMASSKDYVVQRGHNYAIIDEADSILIDEARTPLIIAGEGTDVSRIYIACDQLAKTMERGEQSKEFNKMDAMVGDLPEETGDFIIHEKERIVALTPQGIKKVEDYFGLQDYADPKNILIQHSMDVALRAVHIMKRDQDYIVKEGEVQIVDTFTGRVLPGRRYTDGLHQAIEAKERVKIQEENRTVASTTYQSFFRKYKKICGMTGTAYTEKKEFASTYGLKTVVVPTNRPMIRKDRPDKIYVTKEGKYEGVLAEVEESLAKGQPVLVGTASVRASEEVSRLFTEHQIPHRVLNAKQDAQEAEIIAQAGVSGTVTVATNMAGRGTDIIPDEAAIAAGGLKVIGTERHEAERIDNQLRGRSGRQGNPGESVFCISTDDDMVRMFAGDRFKSLVEKGVYDPYERVEGRIFPRAVKTAQKKVEDNHFGQRKNILDFDRVDDSLREMVYTERRKLLAGDDVKAEARVAIERYVEQLVCGTKKTDMEAVLDEFSEVTGIAEPAGVTKDMSQKQLGKALKEAALAAYGEREAEVQDDIRNIERYAILQSIDSAWTELLSALEYLRQDIYYLSYAQIDPKSGYAIKAFELYRDMRANVYRMTTYALFHFHLVEKRKIDDSQEIQHAAIAG